MAFIRGIDSDNYDGAVPAEHFKRLYDQYDVRFNIIGLEARMPFAKQQQEACESVGIKVPFAYKFLYWRDDDLERMKDACRFGSPIAIDCEAAVPGWSPDRVVERIGLAKDLLRREGQYWGIYTGAWWWPDNTRNNTDFKDDPLWHAAYPFGGGNLPPIGWLPPPSMPVNYGGWTHATVHQFADVAYGDDLGPWDFDMNAADESILGQPAPVRVWAWGNEQNGVEIRGLQQVTWFAGVDVYAIGDPEGVGLGRIAKRFNADWWWLRKGEDGNAYWSQTEGD